MKRKTEKIYVGQEIDFIARAWEDKNSSIDEVIELLTSARIEGATHVKFRAICDSDGFSDICQIDTFYNKIESDEDFEKRLRTEELREEKEKAENEKKARQDYEILKARFEKE